MANIGGLATFDGGPSSGGGGSGSGIQSVNGQTGPAISITGVNGIDVNAGGNVITVNGASLSGLVSVRKYSAAFSSITSGQFNHGLGTRDVVINIYEESPIPIDIIPRSIIRDTPDIVSLLFSRPQSGRIVIIG